MKKFTVLMLAALLVVAFAMPASALDNIFGGYWRTRAYQQKNFDGDNNPASPKDLRQIDTRTRLFYTAKINDKLKFVNRFEMDAVWGEAVAAANYGDTGADGVAVEVKNSYADFNVGPVNFLVGVQNFTLARGFISDDDASGAKAIWKVNEGLYLPFIYQKMREGGAGDDENEQDIEMYVFTPIVYLSKDIKINPYYVFLHSEDGVLMPGFGGGSDNLNAHVLGFDFDVKMGAASFWFTGVKQFGTATELTNAAGVGLVTGRTNSKEIKLKGFLVAAGGKFDLGKADIHGQAFWASGENNTLNAGLRDGDIDAYFVTASTAYYWSEIMGGGIFDNAFPNAQGSNGAAQTFNTIGPVVTNIKAVNLGATVKPMDKLAITADLWWAKLAEKNMDKEDSLGIEANLKITYTLVEGLTLDIVGAYLWAGDAMETNTDGKNVKNPMEVGTRLSLSF